MHGSMDACMRDVWPGAWGEGRDLCIGGIEGGMHWRDVWKDVWGVFMDVWGDA